MLALVFPGQGAQAPEMTEAVQHLPGFRVRYEQVCELAKTDVLQATRAGDTELLNQNLVSSLMTVLVSTLMLDELRARGDTDPTHLAGYSVGQWSAMYAAGMLTFDALVSVLAARARMMDRCMSEQAGAMAAVIGVGPEPLERIVAELRAEGQPVFVSNYNCFGQYSISGARRAVELAEARLRDLRPKKLVRLPVSGAWHSPLLAAAESEFHEFLQHVALRAAQLPVIDNVTADWFSSDEVELRTNLARHLSHPVRWEAGVRKLVALGCTDFIEIGYGNTLQKFGFFLDRRIRFLHYRVT